MCRSFIFSPKIEADPVKVMQNASSTAPMKRFDLDLTQCLYYRCESAIRCHSGSVDSWVTYAMCTPCHAEYSGMTSHMKIIHAGFTFLVLCTVVGKQCWIHHMMNTNGARQTAMTYEGVRQVPPWCPSFHQKEMSFIIELSLKNKRQ